MKKFVSILLCMLMIFSLSSCIVIRPGNPDTTDGEGTTAPTITYPHSDMPLAASDATIATSGDFATEVNLFRYVFVGTYNNYLSNYYYYLSYIGLDPSVPLHDQNYFGEEDGGTWYEYFIGLAKEEFERYMRLYMAAVNEGMTLSEQDQKDLDEHMESLTAYAEAYDMTAESYLAEYYGEGMTPELYRKALEFQVLGYNYYTKKYNGYEVTDEMIREAYEADRKSFDSVDYLSVTIHPEYDQSDSEEAVEAAKQETRAKLEQIASLLQSGKSLGEAYYEVFPTDAEITDEELEEFEEHRMNVGARYGNFSEKYEEVANWLFDSERQENDTYIMVSENDAHTLYMIVKPMYRVEGNSVDVRHVLLGTSSFSTSDAAQAKAEELLAMLEELETPEERIEKIKELVEEFSDDTGSKTTGGLYEKVIPGQMVTSFNDWCFDPERQPGDVGLVESDYGFHVMYFDGYNQELWAYYVDESIREKWSEDFFEELKKSYIITYDEALLDAIYR